MYRTTWLLCSLFIFISSTLDGRIKRQNLKIRNQNLLTMRPERVVEPTSNEVTVNYNRPSKIVRHRSRDLSLINSTLVDSSKNGYGMLTGIPSPLAYDLNGGWVMAYRQWKNIEESAGFLALAKSPDGQNWFIQDRINKTYPEGQTYTVPNPALPTNDGAPQARYPSAIFISGSNFGGAAIWNEYTSSAYGGGSFGGVPMYIYDQNPITDVIINMSPMMHLNNGCINAEQGQECDPPDLWNGNVQFIQNDNSQPRLLALYDGWTSSGLNYMIHSNSFNNGDITLADPYIFHDEFVVDQNGYPLWLGTQGFPDYHINENGIGYMGLSSYAANYANEEPYLHTFFFKKTTDYGETWTSDQGYQNSGYYYIPDSVLIRLSDSLYTLWTDNPEQYPDRIWYNEAMTFDGDDTNYYLTPGFFFGYKYDIKTDYTGGLHIIMNVLPYLCRDEYDGCEDNDGNGMADNIITEDRFGNSGMYHFFNPDPLNTPNNWTASFVKDMSDTYYAQYQGVMTINDPWNYFFPKISLSEESNNVVWFSTFAVSEFESDAEEFASDIDIFIASSIDNGITWSNPKNVSNTNSSTGYGNYEAIETNVYLADRAKDNQVGIMFQMPDFNVETFSPAGSFEDYKNRVYFATYGDTIETGSQSYLFVSTTGSDQNGSGLISNPYQTIQKAINESSDGNTVFVNIGVYLENINFNGKNIIVQGADRRTTVINGGQNGSVVIFESGEDSTTVLKNITITNGSADIGGGVKITNSNPTLLNVYISENNADNTGGAIYINNSALPQGVTCNISNVIIVENTASNYPAIAWPFCKILLSQSTIANNTSSDTTSETFAAGGGNNTHIDMVNSIFWNDSIDFEIGESIGDQNNAFNAQYSLIRNSIENVIDNDPLFSGVEYSDYSIAENSPCAGGGENGSDIGAFGVGCGLMGGPVLEAIQDQNVDEDNSLSIPLTAYSLSEAEIVFSAWLPIPNTVNLSIEDNHILTMEPVLNWNGNIQITVTALDSYGLSDAIAFYLNVNSVNDPVIINSIDDVTISEDEGEAIISASAIDVDGDSLYFSFSHNANLVNVEMIENGIFEISSITEIGGEEEIMIHVSDGEYLDSTSFTVTITPMNDPPLEFGLISPTIVDTFQISTTTDETIPFTWEPSFDVDSDVTYKVTVTLDYFGNVFTNEYGDITDTTTGIAGYEYAILMTNLNLPRWNMDYVIEASDEEFNIVSDIGEFVLQNTSLSIDGEMIPEVFALHQNYPNPFNPTTQIRFDLPKDSYVSIDIYDLMGRKIKSLVNKNQAAGYRSVHWNATNDLGQSVSAGMYIYTIQAGEFRQNRKMVLLK